jgi:tetratricopeptide (TPR) repeat protein
VSATPTALSKACNNKELAIFCGAGISMLPPSCIPDWLNFNQSVLDIAKEMAMEALPTLDKETREAVDRLFVKDFNLVAFSDELNSMFAGDSWFPVLGVLDSEMPNANHYALADLADRGILKVIVTTNFDTLIERAFREKGIHLSVYAHPNDYLAPQQNNCRLYKIHGTTKEAKTLVDTVAQKLAGLPLIVKHHLGESMKKYHFLFMGFSGADLKFSADYLGVASSVCKGPGISWLTSPGRDPYPEVKSLIDSAGEAGVLIEGKLPDFLGELGASLANLPEVDPALQAKVDANAKAEIREWLRSDHIGSLVCASYIERLLFRVGDRDVANRIRAEIGKHPDIVGDVVSLSSPVAVFSLAISALARRDTGDAKRWLERALLISRSVTARFQEANVPLSPDHEREQQENFSAIYTNLSVCYRHEGMYKEAKKALAIALPLAEAAQHHARIGQIHINHALLEQQDGKDPEAFLDRLSAAKVHLAQAGNAGSLFEVANLMAETYIDLAEYGCADKALREAESYAQVANLGPKIVAIKITKARLHVRRGIAAAAMDCLKEARAIMSAADDLEASDAIDWEFCRLLGWYKPALPDITTKLDSLISHHSSAPTGGSVKLAIPSKQDLEDYRRKLLEGEIPECNGQVFLERF